MPGEIESSLERLIVGNDSIIQDAPKITRIEDVAGQSIGYSNNRYRFLVLSHVNTRSTNVMALVLLQGSDARRTHSGRGLRLGIRSVSQAAVAESPHNHPLR